MFLKIEKKRGTERERIVCNIKEGKLQSIPCLALKKMKLRTCADRSVDNVLKVELDTRGGQRERGREQEQKQ